MIVRCLTTEMTPKQRSRLGASFPAERAAKLTADESYLVLGLQYDVGSIIWGTGAWVQLSVEPDRVLFAPLYLFELIDSRPSRLWDTRLWEDGSVTLWPPSFYREYYHDDLAAGDPDVVDDFRQVLAELAEESEVEPYKRRSSTLKF